MEVLKLGILLACLGMAIAQISSELHNFKEADFQKKFLHKKKYRPVFHVSIPMGWLNDPAGFVYFNRQYHLLFQYHPYNDAWGHIRWGHVISDNLVDWAYYPPALVPKEYYEKHGCLAGSAVVQNDYLTLFYTGNVITGKKTQQNQNVAISSDGVNFQKYLYNPIIKESPYPNLTVQEFKNPKVWRFRNMWYMIIAAMSPNSLGQLLLYTSRDMFNWQLNSTVAESYGDMGYMWESPDFFELDGQHVLVLSARGVQTDGYRFRNLYQTGYVIGNFDYLAGRFEEIEISTATFNELDYGHDFYAAQTMQSFDGRRLLVAWLGMWDSSFDESHDSWTSMLTLIRELELTREGRLIMKPLSELVELRSEILENAWYSPGEAFYAGSRAFELIVNSSVGANEAILMLEWNGELQYMIRYSSDVGEMSVDRGGEDGVRRASWHPVADRINWRIFVDHSSVEIFCGHGDVVFSSRIYPEKAIRLWVAGDTQLHIVQYKLRRSFGMDRYKHRKHNMMYHKGNRDPLVHLWAEQQLSR